MTPQLFERKMAIAHLVPGIIALIVAVSLLVVAAWIIGVATHGALP